MSVLPPPRLATWLLSRLAPAARRESLIGDLVEEYQRRRSRGWYWRQALSAIAVGAAREIRDHKALALRASAVGVVAYVLLSFPAVALTMKARLWLTLFVSEGWAMFWLNRLSSAFFSALACGGAGWFVARSHRGAPAVVLLYALADLVFEYGMVLFLFTTQPRAGLSEGELIVPLVLLLTRPFSILIGGLWGVGSRRYEGQREPEPLHQ